MIIKVQGDLCCGTRLCLRMAPEVYKLDELGYNRMDGCEVPPHLEEDARRGAAACPESAISLSDS
jgi:ferredoxin